MIEHHVTSMAASIDDVARGEWDALAAGATVYSSWRWLRMMEAACREPGEACVPSYGLVRGSDGTLVGALPVYSVQAMPDPAYDPTWLFGDLTDSLLAAPWLPCIIAGGRSGYHGRVLTAPTLGSAERDAALRSLVFACRERVDAGRGARWLWFPYLPEADALSVRQALGPESILLFTTAETAIEITWGSLEEYLDSMPQHRRNTMRREMRAFRDDDSVLRLTRLDEVWEAVAPLYANLLHKYGSSGAGERVERGYRRQAVHMSDSSLVWLAELSGKPVGFSLQFLFNGALYARHVGFAYELQRKFDYFNLLFYEPIRWASQRDVQSLELGVGMFQGKLQRGGVPRPLWSVVYPAGGAPRELRDAVRQHNRDRIGRFASENDRHAVHVLDVSDWYETAERAYEDARG